MLILTRKLGEAAPPNIAVLREEILRKVRSAKNEQPEPRDRTAGSI